MEMQFAWDTVQLDVSKMKETDEHLIFHDVVFAREIVHEYDDGMAYKTADELEAYWWTVDGRWAHAGKHPDSGIIMHRDDIHGKTVNPRFVKNLKDAKTSRTMVRGVIGDLIVFKDRVSPKVVSDLKSGKKPSVSIGFFYRKDDVPGVVKDGALKGQEYDYIQRDLMHDHLAFAIDAGRCEYPLCGIGADTLIDGSFKMALDPEETETHIHIPVIKNTGQFEKCRTTTFGGKLPAGIQAVYCKYPDEEDADEDAEEKWVIQKYIFTKSDSWTMEKAKTWVKEHKDDDVMSDIAKDMTLEEIETKIQSLKDARKALREEINKLYDDGGSKERQEKIDTLWDEIQDLNDELMAYREAKVAKITGTAGTEDCDVPLDKMVAIVNEITTGEDENADALKALVSDNVTIDLLTMKATVKGDSLKQFKDLGLEFEGCECDDGSDAGPRTEAERAKAHFELSDEEWEDLSEEEKQEYIDKLPKRGSAEEEEEEEDALTHAELISRDEINRTKRLLGE